MPVPQQPGAEAGEQGRDAADEIESAEAGGAQVRRGGVGEGLGKIVDGLKRPEERMGSDFSFSKLLLDKAQKGEKFTR